MDSLIPESQSELNPEDNNFLSLWFSWLKKNRFGFEFFNLKNRIFTLVLLLLVIAVSAGGYYWRQSHSSNKSSSQANETAKIIAAVGKLIVLPSDEDPAIATVSNPDLLKNQAFFAQAKKGDKVLVYAKAKKAILYDPVLNKIVEVAPINLGTNQNTPAPTPPPAKK